MVDDEEQLLRFVKKCLPIILASEFDDRTYREHKKEFFPNKIPKDREIAKTAINYLIKNSGVKDFETIEKWLKKEFFAANINDPDYFFDKLKIKEEKIDIDLASLENEEYKNRKIQELKEQAKKEIHDEYLSEIQQQVKEQQAKFDSIHSVLDQEQEFIEPFIDERKETKYDDYEPWWKKLNLKSDPFPSTIGLQGISDDLYDDIIIINDLYDKYVYFINEIPSELFKNTIFYGQYGSGKTTLFEYLRKALTYRKIYSIFLILAAEADYQNFLLKFKHKLRKELINLYTKLSITDLEENFESISLDNAIPQLFQLIHKKSLCEGFVIFIDDFYKPQGFQNTSLNFLNHLQTFKAELIQEINLPNIGFFISAPLEWKIIVNEKPVYSGSVSRKEDIPIPTIGQAHNLLNKRLAAFAKNKENCPTIRLEFRTSSISYS